MGINDIYKCTLPEAVCCLQTCNVYVRRQVRIRTIRGFCCTKLGSWLCAGHPRIIYAIRARATGERTVPAIRMRLLCFQLGAKCGFAPSVDFVAQSLDLGFAQAIRELFAQSTHVQQVKGRCPQ